NENLYAPETVEQIAGRYMECLCEIIEHCRSKEAGGYTPSDFPLARLDQHQLDLLIGRGKEIRGEEIRGEEIEDIYVLSPMQLGLLFHALYEPQSEAYFNQMSCRMEGWDAGAFRKAGERLIERNP